MKVLRITNFDYILVYDVSRWGRFQDQDEAAYYEFLCKRKGKKVIYITRGIPNSDNQLLSTLQTSIERYMAAEYSKQLSSKVFFGSVKVSEQGYSAGGTAPYGLNRLLLDIDKKPISILKRGEHKLISNQRVSFISANDQSTKVVKMIFYLFVHKKFSTREIASLLNQNNLASPQNTIWTSASIERIIQNQAYIGTRVYNKTANKLKSGRKKNDISQWILCKNAFEGIIPQRIFVRAQKMLVATLENDQIGEWNLNKIKRILHKKVLNILVKKNLINVDHASLKEIQIPIIISKTIKNSNYNWCFTCSLDKISSPFAICIGILSKRKVSIYIIPTSKFNRPGFLLLREKDLNYEKFKVNGNNLEEIICSLY